MAEVKRVMLAKDVDAESKLFPTLSSSREAGESAPSERGASKETAARGRSHARAEPQVGRYGELAVASWLALMTSLRAVPGDAVRFKPLIVALSGGESPSGGSLSIIVPIRT